MDLARRIQQAIGVTQHQCHVLRGAGFTLLSGGATVASRRRLHASRANSTQSSIGEVRRNVRRYVPRCCHDACVMAKWWGGRYL